MENERGFAVTMLIYVNMIDEQTNSTSGMMCYGEVRNHHRHSTQDVIRNGTGEKKM